MTISFKVGQSYATRSACDHDCIYAYKIERRTAKSVWIEIEGKIERRAINVYAGVESFKPHGRYSMSATISADRTEDDVRAPDRRRAAIENSPRPVHFVRPSQLETVIRSRTTAPAIELLKQNVGVVAEIDRRFDQATAFIARFAGSFPNQAARTDHIRTILNMVSMMDLDDFAELAEIRRYLRGE